MTNFESLLKDYLASGDAGDLDLLDRYLHDDVILHDPDGLTARGLEHEREAWRAARAAMQNLRHDVREVVSSGSVIAARVTVSGTLRGTFAGVSLRTDESSGLIRPSSCTSTRARCGRCGQSWTPEASTCKWELSRAVTAGLDPPGYD